jgi:hypothetical protein
MLQAVYESESGPSGDVHHAGECPLMGEWWASLANKLNCVA